MQESMISISVPESLVNDFRRLVDQHSKGMWINFDGCVDDVQIDEAVFSSMPESALKFFTRFRHYQDDLKTASDIGVFLELHEEVIKGLPKEEKRYLKKLTEPKRKHLIA